MHAERQIAQLAAGGHAVHLADPGLDLDLAREVARQLRHPVHALHQVVEHGVDLHRAAAAPSSAPISEHALLHARLRQLLTWSTATMFSFRLSMAVMKCCTVSATATAELLCMLQQWEWTQPSTAEGRGYFPA